MIFNAGKAPQRDDPITLGCGQCIGCRIKRAQDWAIRLSHEAQYHDQSCFITATFDNYHLAMRENPGSVDVREVQLLVKRLRNSITRSSTTAGTKIRFFAVGEYGEESGRPHYHLLIFGWKPDDGTIFKTTHKGSTLYNSEHLSELWNNQGHINYGNVTYDSAAYCAGYITKKFTGAEAERKNTWIDPISGEVRPRIPEFATMSRRPGLGTKWIEDNWKDAINDDYVVMKGKKRALPRFYDKWLMEHHPEHFAEVQDKRRLEFMEQPHISEERRLDMHLCRWHHHTQRLRDGASKNGTDDLHHLRQQSQSIPAALLHAKLGHSITHD